MAKVWIGLGSNVGDRLGHLRRGLGHIERLPGTALLSVSSVYECEPVGKTDQPWFLNAAAAIETSLKPHDLLREVLRIERLCGRERLERWGPRTLDIDILVYDDRVECSAGLIIPHPRIRERAFVLLPLAEIAPDLVVPGGTDTVSELALRADATGSGVSRVGGPPAPDGGRA
jgi:2-amino-4-hydroxy-6-hydroxymethyldihydropteridine diphosphokinase